MRVSRDYVFDLVEQLGVEVQKLIASGRECKHLSDKLWSVQRRVAYRHMTPKNAVRELQRTFHSSPVSPVIVKLLEVVSN